MLGLLKRWIGTAQSRALTRYRRVVAKVNEWDLAYQALSDEAIRAKTDEFKKRLACGATTEDLLPEAYAVVKAVCRRLKGTEFHVSGYQQCWDMVPYDEQILGAIALHHQSIAEMQTGEGKTLTATMPLYLNALTGKPVHLVTVNDYLAKRDAEWVGTIFRWLGLSVGALTNDVPPQARRQIYLCDVVYGTASEFGFDYLRDHSTAMNREEQSQRGHYFAMIDEVDSILIDEARTPLIISGPAPLSRQMYDVLKDGVEDLVRKQRDLCNRLATEAKKTLEDLGWKMEGESSAPQKVSKEQQKKEEEALCKLWLVSKGTPRNRILSRIKENADLRALLEQLDTQFYGEQSKEAKRDELAKLFILIDERGNDYEITDKGIAAWQDGSFGTAEDFVMLDLGDEFAKVDLEPSLSEEERQKKKVQLQEEDAKRKERAHNLRQMLRAHLLMEKDVEYIVQDQKVVIIDENTGRPQPGRRFSDGLHQAIEAKERVAIQKETQTYATVTLQNYFRLYQKLAGMTGTGITEAAEFKEIYHLDVLEIPTHLPCRRVDKSDEIYMTLREKYAAILEEVKKIHEQGAPILLGTESVEASELLSRVFKQARLPHDVLNARHHEAEAQIIAGAGRCGAITIATNMAGRGTDIKLEPKAKELGGLHVIGCSRHSSRRIDRQLRGRSARLGDPGMSKFYMSFEDNLLRLFASPRITAMLKRFRPPEGEPISASILDRAIETAQKRVEQRNYMIRKHTLEYDDVMDKQRKEIYAFRHEVLHADQVLPLIEDLLKDLCASVAQEHFSDRGRLGSWDVHGYQQWLVEHFPVTFTLEELDDDGMTLEDLETLVCTQVVHALKEKIQREKSKVEAPKGRSKNAPLHPVEEALRSLVTRKIDQLWQEHLLHMDHLRSEVSLRVVGQKDPLMEFKKEAFRLFHLLSRHLKEEVARAVFKFEMIPYRPSFLHEIMNQLNLETGRSLAEIFEGPSTHESPGSATTVMGRAARPPENRRRP